MLTKEECQAIDRYCRKTGADRKHRLEEFGIPSWKYYRAMRKYRESEEAEGRSFAFRLDEGWDMPARRGRKPGRGASG